jgi:ATP-binding cassette subfamily C (CFTR/MRP) protein 1
MITNLLTLLTAITAVFMRHRLTTGTVGLMITYAIQITQSLQMLVREASEIETSIVGVERINEYAELTPEAPWKIHENKPPPQWPTNGEIRYVDYETIFVRNHLEKIMNGYRFQCLKRRGIAPDLLKDSQLRIVNLSKKNSYFLALAK